MERQLALREDGDTEIAIYWNDQNDTVTLYVTDPQGYQFQEIPKDQALEAYEHPYVYL